MTGISTESLGALLLLALTDSLSFGTLAVPVWLLMSPGRLRPHRILIYLLTVAAAYFAIGIVLVTGGRAVVESAGDLFGTTPFLVAQLAVGAILLASSFVFDTKAARARAAQRSGQAGRLRRWRERAMSDESAVAALMGLAVTAVLVEVASMLPYLGATGIIASQMSRWQPALALLAAYCLVMIVPALILTAARLIGRRMVEGPLRRLDGWLTRNARSTTLWIIGIAGFFLASSALQNLGWLGG